MAYGIARMLFGAVVALSVLGCSKAEPDALPLGHVSEIRVTVLGNGIDSIATIKDPERIWRIVTFVDARRSGWETPPFGVPVAAVHAQFYDGEKFKGSFGAGKTFFETNRVCPFCSRPASSTDVHAFIALLQVDPIYLDWKKPPAQH